MSISVNNANSTPANNKYLQNNDKQYCQLYAERKGISYEEASKELFRKYGEPRPEAYAHVYADEKGISFEDAKAELSENYGYTFNENDPGLGEYPELDEVA